MKKPSRTTLRNKADKLFSQYIRNHGSCEWCGKKDDTLQCAHIFTRSYNCTRWEPINALCLCASCHFKWHKEPIEATEWVKEYLGEDIYSELRLKAHNDVKKIDLVEVIRKLQEHEAPYA